MLFVGAENSTRSAYAALMLASMLSPREFDIRSAGTRSVVGAPMSRTMADIAVKRGVPAASIAEHRARVLTKEDLAHADLVLTMTTDLRRDALALHPDALPVTFTMWEFVRLTQTMPGPRRHGSGKAGRQEVIGGISARRGTVTPKRVDAADSIEDPSGRPARAFRRTADDIDDALYIIHEVLLLKSQG